MGKTNLRFVAFWSLLAVGMFAATSLLVAAPASAGNAPKVEICHIPPGNPANAHTIRVSENAIQSHLKHGDFLGACEQPCEERCDDGNACTRDYCDENLDCQSDAAVDCNDGNECTIDSCNPDTGGCMTTPVPAGAPCVWSDELDCTLEQGKCDDVGECKPINVLGCCDTDTDCIDENLCTDETCNPTTNTCESTVTVECDNDACRVGVCIDDTGACEYTDVVCEPSLCQTLVECHPVEGCIFETDPNCCNPLDPNACYDGQNCTADVCDPETNLCSNPDCRPNLGECITVVTCNEDCSPFAVEELFCDDANPCTNDSCVGEAGAWACLNELSNCDDGDLCTDDSCDPIAGECMSVPTTNPPELVETFCADGLDNDCDGATDTEDLVDCAVSPCSFNNGGCGDERVFLCAEDEAGEIGCSVRDEIYRPIRDLAPFPVDLSGVDLSGADLSSYVAPDGSTMVACFWRTNLSGAALENADFAGANLTDANLSGANLTNANLTKAALSSATLEDADFAGANLTDASLWRANLTNANLSGADLHSSCIRPEEAPEEWCLGFPHTNLEEANLSGANLSGANLSDAWLIDADLTNANLASANLSHTLLWRANLTNANLLETDLTSANLRSANLSGTELRLATLLRVNLSRTQIPNMDLSGIDLSLAVFDNANLSGANLSGATLWYVHFIGTNLVGADLSETDLTSTTLSDTDLAGANLTNADLSGLDLSQYQNNFRGANFTNANLTGANLSGAALENADFAGANLTDANLSGANLTNVNFRRANLYNANFAAADVTYADFSMANLQCVMQTNPRGCVDYGINISYAQNIRDAVFRGTQLQGLNFHRADLSGADLTGANLYWASLDSSDLSGANLHLANLNRTLLRSTNLHDADVSDADMTQASLARAIFTPADLSNVVLTQATYDDETVFPAGFVPSDYGMIDRTGSP